VLLFNLEKKSLRFVAKFCQKNLGNLFFFVKNILENEYSIANSHFKKKQGKKWKKNLKQVCNFFTIVYNINKCSRFF